MGNDDEIRMDGLDVDASEIIATAAVRSLPLSGEIFPAPGIIRS
jgi:hypothetical protein